MDATHALQRMDLWALYQFLNRGANTTLKKDRDCRQRQTKKQAMNFSARIICIVGIVNSIRVFTSAVDLSRNRQDDEVRVLKGQSVSHRDDEIRRLRKRKKKKKKVAKSSKKKASDGPNRQPRPHHKYGVVERPNGTKRPLRPNGDTTETSNEARPNNGNRPNQDNDRPNSILLLEDKDEVEDLSCFTSGMYDELDADIAKISRGISNQKAKSHFLGGIVRLAAHDFMDFDRRSNIKLGPDGCIDDKHPSNAGLETIWCPSCEITKLHEEKYSHISRADYWIAASNAVIRQTSVNNSLDLKREFRWGRKDKEVCRGSGQRLPESTGCDQVEDVFLDRMGLGWKDAVALLGAHTLGRGDNTFSGHHGSWVSERQSQTFDKQYYEDLFIETWRPRNMGTKTQDWTTGAGSDRVMLNTDICLVFDIDSHIEHDTPCCTRTGICPDREASRRKCPMYKGGDSRRQAASAAREMLGGSVQSNNNTPFYDAFARAWGKATTIGRDDLKPLRDRC